MKYLHIRSYIMHWIVLYDLNTFSNIYIIHETIVMYIKSSLILVVK